MKMIWVREFYFPKGCWAIIGDDKITKSDFSGIDEQLLAVESGYTTL